MFGYLKNFVRRLAEKPQAASSETEVITLAQAGLPEAAQLDEPAVAPRGHARGNGYHNGGGVEIRLSSILSGLPLELRPYVTSIDVGDATISVPLEKVLSQLSRGAVKISFGELRVAAPGLFAPAADRDRVLVTLPLSEILSKLNPALITRRRVQTQVEIPAEISSPAPAIRSRAALRAVARAKGIDWTSRFSQFVRY